MTWLSLHARARAALVGVVALLGGAALPAQTPPDRPPAPSLSLAEALTGALGASPTVGEAGARARVASYDVLRARAKHLPTLGVDFGKGVLGSSDSDTRVARAAVNLWAGGGIASLVSQQTEAFEAARERLAASCTEAAIQLSDAYLGALKAEALARRSIEQLGEFNRIRAMVEEIVRVDRGRRSDLEQVITRQELVRLSSFDAAAQARVALANLERVFGAPVLPMRDGVDALVPALPTQLADAQREALAASPSVLAAERDVLVARRGVDVAKAARWPQLNLVAERIDERSGGLRSRDNALRLQTQWTLFNGGSDYWGERAGLETVQAAQARLEDTRRALALAVAQTWDARDLAQRRGAQAPEQLRAARSVVEANSELFRLGRRGVLDMLTATNDLNTVLVSQIDARHEAQIQAWRLAARTGRLLAGLALPAGALCARESISLPEGLGGLAGFGATTGERAP